MEELQTLNFYRGSDYLELPRDPHKWIVEPLLPVGGSTNIYGKPKAGKSFAALGMAAAVSNGHDNWNGFKIHKTGPVAYLQADTPRGEWAERIAKLQAHGYSTDNLYLADMLTIPYPFNVVNEQHYKLLKAQLAAIAPVLVVIDTLRETHPGDENSSEHMRNVIVNIVAASRPAAIMLVSHARKDGIMHTVGGEDLMDDARGSSYVSGRMDVIIKMTKHRFTYQGRATGLSSIEVDKDEDGFIILPDQTKRSTWGNEALRMLADESLPYDHRYKKDGTPNAQKLAQFINGGSLKGEHQTIRKFLSEMFKQQDSEERRAA